MKRIAIAVIAILPAISLYSLWLLVSSCDTEDIFTFMLEPCEKDCAAKEDALPVGSVIGFNFHSVKDRTVFIGKY